MANKTVLIIDDDRKNIFALSAILRSKGFQCLEAHDGIEGIAVLKANPKVSIVLMDMMMPEMDGYAAITEIRKDSKYKDLPIIAVTAQAMKGDKEKCMEAGAAGYVAKPIDPEELFRLINNHIPA